MFKLNFRIDCPDGKYAFDCDCNEKVEYKVESDIPGLENTAGEIMPDAFSSLVEKATIEKWDREYSGSSLIEDEIIWNLEYIKENRIYRVKGHESYEPYNFEYLLNAIKLCDKQLEYFGW